ncbi:MAG: D-Ala-D-Ala carboxypeptidase family metallohydrolase [Cyanobacteria bacterium J06631_6]
MKLPSGIVVTKNTPIYPGSNFTWGEATKNCSRPIEDLIIDRKVIITAEQIEEKIIHAARNLDHYRELLGNRPIIVTSWYRPRSVNSRVGGSNWSRHQFGDAVDWKSNYLSPSQIAKIIEPQHFSGGYKAYYKFTHTDWRGHKARW